jgi:hypothetical protein
VQPTGSRGDASRGGAPRAGCGRRSSSWSGLRWRGRRGCRSSSGSVCLASRLSMRSSNSSGRQRRVLARLEDRPAAAWGRSSTATSSDLTTRPPSGASRSTTLRVLALIRLTLADAWTRRGTALRPTSSWCSAPERKSCSSGQRWLCCRRLDCATPTTRGLVGPIARHDRSPPPKTKARVSCRSPSTNATPAAVRARYSFSAEQSWEGSATAFGRSRRPPPLLQPWHRHSRHDDAAAVEAIVPGHGLGGAVRPLVSQREAAVRCPTEAVARPVTSASRGPARGSPGRCSRPPRAARRVVLVHCGHPNSRPTGCRSPRQTRRRKRLLAGIETEWPERPLFCFAFGLGPAATLPDQLEGIAGLGRVRSG